VRERVEDGQKRTMGGGQRKRIWSQKFFPPGMGEKI